MPRNLPVRASVEIVPAKSEPEAKTQMLPSALLALRSGPVRSGPVTPSSPSPPPRRGRPTKEDAARELRDAIDARIHGLREESATRKEVMEYFAQRIKELD